jgi:hypothetical protein
VRDSARSWRSNVRILASRSWAGVRHVCLSPASCTVRLSETPSFLLPLHAIINLPMRQCCCSHQLHRLPRGAGTSSLLVWAAGGAPSKDTFWTTDNGNQSTTRGGCDKTGCPPDHSSAGAVLHTMLALFSTGPMGFSDAPGETDPALLARACDSNGTLLQVGGGWGRIESSRCCRWAVISRMPVCAFVHPAICAAVPPHYVRRFNA